MTMDKKIQCGQNNCYSHLDLQITMQAPKLPVSYLVNVGILLWSLYEGANNSQY